MYERYVSLIFDTDGTVPDTEPTRRKAWRKVLGHYGLQYDTQVMIALDGSPTWHIAQAIIELNQADLDPHALARERTETVRNMLLDSVEPFPLVGVAKSRHGRRPVVVETGSESAITEALLTHLGSRRYFDVVVIADHVKYHKPAPGALLLYAQRMGVQPAQCMIFENTDFGIQVAHATGMDAVDIRSLWVKRHRFSRHLPVASSALHYCPATPKSHWWRRCFPGLITPRF